jgi:hypothetical protein
MISYVRPCSSIIRLMVVKLLVCARLQPFDAGQYSAKFLVNKSGKQSELAAQMDLISVPFSAPKRPAGPAWAKRGSGLPI